MRAFQHRSGNSLQIITSVLMLWDTPPCGWTSSVIDDGVGMPADTQSVRSGLGSILVAALARPLGARVEVADAHPGTDVRIVQISAQVDIQADKIAAV